MKAKLFKNLVLLVATSAFAILAQAKSSRVIVAMKTQNSYNQVQNHFQKYGTQNLKSLWQKGSVVPQAFSQIDGTVEGALQNLNSVVLRLSDESEIQKLQMNPDVEFVDREVFYPAPKPIHGKAFMNAFANRRATLLPVADDFVPTETTPWGIIAIHAPQAWVKSNQGAGARVLVLDTGIDKDHPSLSANFEKGKSFVDPSGLAYDYFDDIGHGSHCAGTVAGVMDSSGFTGVAPKAQLLAGKVCTVDGCSSISIVEGINWGISEKVDVISMSLGGAVSTASERKAVLAAFQSGITIVAATGNDAALPDYVPGTVSFPAALPQVIAVGAVDSNLQRAEFSQYGKELAIMAPGVAVLSAVPQGTGRLSFVKLQLGDSHPVEVLSAAFAGAKAAFEPLSGELAVAGLGRPQDFAGANYSGKLVLVQRGEIAFGEKAKNAIAAKAAGLVVYNNAPGLINGTLTEDGSELPISVFMIEQEQGESIVKTIAAGQKASAILQVKKTDYEKFDGTSMATPHISGVVALLKATNKGLSPTQVKQILQQTAASLSQPAIETGSGMVQADKAVAKAQGLLRILPTGTGF